MKNLFFFIAIVIFLGCSKNNETLSGLVEIQNRAQVQPCTQVEFEWNVGSAVQVKKLFDCFSSISSSGATFSVQLCVDVASNLFPKAAVNWKGRPGHAFFLYNRE